MNVRIWHAPGLQGLPMRAGLHLPAGLVALTGDEGSGKTRLLRQLAAGAAAAHEDAFSVWGDDGLWLDLSLPGQDLCLPQELWQLLAERCPGWNAALHQSLVHAFELDSHLHKQLHMLSTGSRRKVALTGLLASGVTFTCLDQPYVALDLASVRVLQHFLSDMADHRSRCWVVADYEADPQLPWTGRLVLEP